MNDKDELLDLLNQIVIYFEGQAKNGGVEKNIFDYYSKIRDDFDFKYVNIHSWLRPYVEANSDWGNQILITMKKVDKLIQCLVTYKKVEYTRPFI